MADADLFADIPTVGAKPTSKPVKHDLFADVPDAPGIGDLLMTGVKKFIPSTGKLIADTVNHLNPMNYPAEGRAISSVVRGGIQNLREMSPPEARGSAPPVATPLEQTAATAAGRQIVRPFTHPLQSFAEDPASTLATLSIPATLGGSALEAAPVGALQAAGRAVTTAGDVMNPVGLTIKGVAAVPKVITKVLPKGVSPAEMAARQARFAQANVEPSYATTGGPLTQLAASVSAKGPLSFGARANNARAVAQTSASAADTAAQFGDARPASLTGQTLQEGINRYTGDVATPGSFKAKVEGMYDNAFAPVLKGEADAVAQSEAAHAKAVGDIKGNYVKQVEDADAARREAAASGIAPKLPQDTPAIEPPELPQAQPTTTTAKTQDTLKGIVGTINSDAVRSVIQDPRIPRILDALQTDPASLRFSDLRQLRTWVRNAQSDPDLILNVGQGNLQKLESSLTDDIYANASNFGDVAHASDPAAPSGAAVLQKLKRTDEYYRKSVDRIQTALQPFVDKSSGEGAYARLQSIAGSTNAADVNSLFRLKRSLQPDDWGDIQASLIQNAGRGPTGEGAFSPSQFVDWYSKIPEQSKDILFGAAGSASKAKPGAAALRAQLDNLVSVADDVSKVEKSIDPVKGASPWQATVTALGFLHPTTILQELSVVGGEAAAAQILTSPKALVWINRLGAASTKGQDAVAPVMANLSRVAKTDAQLQSVYQAANNVLHPPQQKPQDGSGGFDPTQMTDEQLKAAAGDALPPEGSDLHGTDANDRISMINGMSPVEAKALTIAGESSDDPHEMAGVGHVIHNREANPEKYGSTLADILKPGEFNVWENPTKLAELKGTPKYKHALEIAQQIEDGKHADVTGGAQHYYAPKALAELHKTQPEKYPHERPEFAKGDGLPLGESVFYP